MAGKERKPKKVWCEQCHRVIRNPEEVSGAAICEKCRKKCIAREKKIMRAKAKDYALADPPRPRRDGKGAYAPLVYSVKWWREDNH